MASTPICGIAAWPPRALMVISNRLSLAVMAPALVAKFPAGMPGILCIAKTASASKRVNSPSSIIAVAPSPCSSLGWKMKMARPLKSPCRARCAAAPSSMLLCPSWPQACITPSWAERHSGLPVSVIGSASISARKATLASPLPRCKTPTTPVPPTPVWTSSPNSRSSSATRAEVRCSSKPSSGCRWKSRRQPVMSATSSGAMFDLVMRRPRGSCLTPFRRS